MQLTAHDLLAYLPLGTAVVLATRVFLGIRTIGAFAPVLLALTIMQLGGQSTMSMLLVAGGTGLAVAPLLERLVIPRATRLSLLVVAVCAALVATGSIGTDAVAFPLVVVAIVIERTWDSARVDGVLAASKLYLATVGVSFAVAGVLSELSPHLIDRHWAPLAALGAAANLAVGSYRGLRLNELRRFATLNSRVANS